METVNNAAAAVGDAAVDAKNAVVGEPTKTDKAKSTVEDVGEKGIAKTKAALDSGESTAKDAKSTAESKADNADSKKQSAIDAGKEKVQSAADTVSKEMEK